MVFVTLKWGATNIRKRAHPISIGTKETRISPLRETVRAVAYPSNISPTAVRAGVLRICCITPNRRFLYDRLSEIRRISHQIFRGQVPIL